MSRRVAAKTGQLHAVAAIAMVLSLSVAWGLAPAQASVLVPISAQTGEVRDLLAMNSTTMFAATQGGGLWKSTDTGLTWNKVATFPARYVWKIGIPGSAPTTIFAATSVGLYKSTDSGSTWLPRTGDYVRALAVDTTGNTVLIGVPGAGIFRSTDGGATFIDVSAGLGSTDVRAIVLDASGNAYAGMYGSINGGGWGGVFRLASGLTTWTSWNAAGAGGASAIGSQFVTALAINSVALLAATSNGTGDGAGKIYSNNLSGPGWNNPIDPTHGWIFDIESLANDRSDATGHSFLAGTRAFGVWRSANDGATWSQKSSGATYPEVTATTFASGTFPVSTVALVAQRGAGLFYTANITTGGAATWQPASGLAADRVLSLTNHASAAPSTYYMGLLGGGVKKSVNAGGAWSSLIAGFSTGGPDPVLGTATALAAHPSNTNVVYAALRTTGLYTLSGASWTTEAGAPAALMPQDLQFDSTGANLYYSIFNPGGGVNRRTSAGAWSLIEPGIWGGNVGAARIFQSSTGSMIAMMFDELPQRSPTGAPGTWANIGVAAAANDSGFTRLAFNSITEKPGSGGATLVASTNRGIYRSNDNGLDWYRVTSAGPPAMHTALSTVQFGATASPLWAADRSGAIYCSTDDGNTWTSVGQVGAPVIAFKYINGQMHALTDGAAAAKLTATCP